MRRLPPVEELQEQDWRLCRTCGYMCQLPETSMKLTRNQMTCPKCGEYTLYTYVVGGDTDPERHEVCIKYWQIHIEGEVGNINIHNVI